MLGMIYVWGCILHGTESGSGAVELGQGLGPVAEEEALGEGGFAAILTPLFAAADTREANGWNPGFVSSITRPKAS
jgi:hypothetical protein